MSYFGVSTRNGVGLGLGTVPSLTNTPLGYRLAPSLDLSFAGSDTLSPLITFSRTTNATVTGSNGLIQYAPMNLLTFSEQFDNAAWTKDGVTIAANATTSPNGTTTADRYVESALNELHSINSITVTASAGVTYTLSVYAKNAGRFLRLILPTATFGTAASANFDLVSGVAHNTAGSGAEIQAVGDGWYRCSVRVTATNSASGIVTVASTTTSLGTGIYQGDGTSGIFIWGAQLESNATATTYNPTTVKNLLGFTENFDNAAWTKSNAFVQTNLLTYSVFSGAVAGTPGTAPTAWPFVISAGSTAVLGASLTLSVASSARHFINQQVILAANTSYTFSINLTAYSGLATETFVLFNTSAGSIIGPTSIAASGGLGRRSLTVTAGGAGATVEIRIGVGVNNVTSGATSFTFDSPQLVQGTSAGDYKATYAAAAPVGYTDIYGQPFAQKLVEDTATGVHRFFNSNGVTVSTVGPSTYTLYAKAAERTSVRVTDNEIQGADFDLLTGAVSTVSAGVTATATDTGSGWWRLSVTRTSSSGTGRIVAYLLNAGTTTYTGDGTSGIYIFGAQLSDSASVDPYVYQPVAAPTSTAYYGPRFDYDPVTLQPKGLLIEEQRTNLLTYSEQFDNLAWVAVAAGVAANTAVSPSGATTGDSLVPSGVSATHYIYQLIALTLGASYTMTVYAKPNGYNRFMLRESTTAGYFVVFDVSTGTVVNTNSATGTITPAGNGWYRCTMTITAPLTVATVMAIINMPNNGTTYANATFTGDGTSGIYLWGAQLEVGAFATSYIPTVASQVTRAADSASMIGNNFARWYNPNAGTAYVEAAAAATGNYGTYSINSDDNNRFYSNVDFSQVQWVGIANGAIQASLPRGVFSPNVYFKHGAAFTTNDFAAVVNGGAAAVDTVAVMPFVNRLFIGATQTNSTFLNGTIKRIAYYPRRLANTELQAITS